MSSLSLRVVDFPIARITRAPSFHFVLFTTAFLPTMPSLSPCLPFASLPFPCPTLSNSFTPFHPLPLTHPTPVLSEHTTKANKKTAKKKKKKKKKEDELSAYSASTVVSAAAALTDLLVPLSGSKTERRSSWLRTGVLSTTWFMLGSWCEIRFSCSGIFVRLERLRMKKKAPMAARTAAMTPMTMATTCFLLFLSAGGAGFGSGQVAGWSIMWTVMSSLQKHSNEGSVALPMSLQICGGPATLHGSLAHVSLFMPTVARASLSSKPSWADAVQTKAAKRAHRNIIVAWVIEAKKLMITMKYRYCSFYR
eukprot:Rhum_TRINITY_DN14409_c13_g6::Rhum_TRINITY_DN14409_c13_g6_i1::g.88425::m.88425